MLPYIVIFLVVARIAFKIYFHETHRKLKAFKKFPSIDLPLIGHAYRWIGRTTEGKLMRIIGDLTDLSESTIIWFLGIPLVVLNDPEDINLFFRSPASQEKGTAFAAFYGNRRSLLTAHVPFWKLLRRATNSAFSLNSIKSYVTVFNSSAHSLTIELDRHCNNGEFNVAQLVGRCGIDAAIKSHIGIEMTGEELHQIQAMIETSILLMGDRVMHFYYEYVLKVIRTKFGIDYALTKLENYFLDKYGSLLDDDDDDDGVENFLNRTKRMLRTGLISRNDLNENIGIFLFASSSTPSSVASYALLLLAMTPPVQEKLYDELVATLDPNEKDVDYDALTAKLPYLDRVVKEALRLLPGVPLVLRKPDTDVTLADGRVIPANVDVLIPIITVHRNRERWGPDAMRFNPDNFLSDAMEDKHTGSYLPFALGERNCIAYKYATMLVKVIVVHAIRKFRFSTKLTLAELKYGFAVTLKVTNGCMVTVTRRPE